MVDPRLLLAEPDTVAPLTGEISVANLSLAEDDKKRVVDAVSFTVELVEHVAIIGQSGSGKSELALLLARLAQPTGGRITIGGKDIADLPVAVIGRRIGYVGNMPYVFTGTLRDNLLLGLRHRPVRPAEYDEAAMRRRARELFEARRSGNIDFDLNADWIDYESAGVSDAAGLTQRIAQVLERLDFEEDVYALGLRGRLDPAEHAEAAERLIEARKALAQRLVADGITKLGETYDLEQYNSNATVAENLLFGTPIGPVFDFSSLAENAYVLSVLDKLALTDDLVEAGRGPRSDRIFRPRPLQRRRLAARQHPLRQDRLWRGGRGGTRPTGPGRRAGSAVAAAGGHRCRPRLPCRHRRIPPDGGPASA